MRYMNPAYGDWTEEETNWSEKDTEFIRDSLTDRVTETSFEELLREHNEKAPQ